MTISATRQRTPAITLLTGNTFSLDSLAYYHRGLDGEQHERLAAGMILGASLLTARGVPAAGGHSRRASCSTRTV